MCSSSTPTHVCLSLSLSLPLFLSFSPGLYRSLLSQRFGNQNNAQLLARPEQRRKINKINVTDFCVSPPSACCCCSFSCCCCCCCCKAITFIYVFAYMVGGVGWGRGSGSGSGACRGCHAAIASFDTQHFCLIPMLVTHILALRYLSAPRALLRRAASSFTLEFIYKFSLAL